MHFQYFFWLQKLSLYIVCLEQQQFFLELIESFEEKLTRRIELKRLSFITQFKIEFLLPFTGCRWVLQKMPEFIFVSEIWITYNNEKVLWYRFYDIVIRGKLRRSLIWNISLPDLKTINVSPFLVTLNHRKKGTKWLFLLVFHQKNDDRKCQTCLIKLNLNKLGEITLICKNCRESIKMFFCSSVNKK